MSSDTWLALYGAIVATIALGWQVWSLLRENPDVRVSAAAPSRVLKPNVAGGYSRTVWITFPIAFYNAGGRPLTIISGDFRLSSFAPLASADVGLMDDGDATQAMPSDVLPMLLAPGDARTIMLTRKFETTPGRMFEQGYSGALTFTLETTGGTVKREAVFTLDATVLNRRIPD